MILRPGHTDLFVVTQPDHAGLSADLVERFVAGDFATRATREAVLVATRHHDIGWTEEDAAPHVDPRTGLPYEFTTAPTAVRQRIWPRAVAALRDRSSYVAALVAQHAITVYGRYRDDSDWRAFHAEMERLRDDCYDAADRPGFVASALDPPHPLRQLFLQDYAFVATGDLMSLIFCAGWTDPYDVDVFRIVSAGAELHLTPDPFDGNRVPFTVRARRLPNRAYPSDDALRDALAQAPEEWLEGVALGAPR